MSSFRQSNAAVTSSLRSNRPSSISSNSYPLPPPIPPPHYDEFPPPRNLYRPPPSASSSSRQIPIRRSSESSSKHSNNQPSPSSTRRASERRSRAQSAWSQPPEERPPRGHHRTPMQNYEQPMRSQQSLPSLRRASHVSARQLASQPPLPNEFGSWAREDSPTSSQSQTYEREREQRPMRHQQSLPSLRRSAQATLTNREGERPPLPGRSTSTRARGKTVVDRMQEGGWIGVQPSRSTSSSEASSSPTLGAPDLDKRTSADSGYSENRGGEQQPSYFGQWSKIKNAVVGWSGAVGDENIPPVGSNFSAEPTTGWGKLVSAVVRSSDEDEDGIVGPDGETKLGRCIKEYHISRADTSEDLPTWLFSGSELSSRAAREASRQAAEVEEEEQQTYSMRRNQILNRHLSEMDSNEADEMGRRDTGPTMVRRGMTTSRTTDRLKALANEKRRGSAY
ncbi:hypothetical protein P7C70_g8662, partial [Phenoliferia sp. Uapishka_3]